MLDEADSVKNSSLVVLTKITLVSCIHQVLVLPIKHHFFSFLLVVLSFFKGDALQRGKRLELEEQCFAEQNIQALPASFR